jgi:ABC-2 type transport system ATP-binding protein
VININNLEFGYGRNTLFDNLNLTLQPGSIPGLLGKNGAGKTTLLRLMAGLLFPHNGEISIMNRNPENRSPDYLENLFFLPEEFDLPNITPALYEKLYAPFYPAFDSDRYKKCLEEFELYYTKKFKTLSFGQKKKFMISFGFATGCRFMLLDEPTNGLDIPSKTQLRRVLASTVTDDNMVVISTHQVRDLENIIDPVIILDEGQIIFNRSIEEINRRLRVTTEPDPPEPERVLYFEKTFNGYMSVSENKTPEESNINLETLFSTVISNRKKVSDVFEEGVNNEQHLQY